MIRWLLWNLNCWRGRRCADVRLAATQVPEEWEEEMVGAAAHLHFRCNGCGTEYRRDALLGLDGAFTELERVRVG